MIQQAVILAAGMGQRLQGVPHRGPKGLLRLEPDAPSLVERSIALMEKAGIQRLFVVTGHQAEYFAPLEQCNRRVQCLYNPEYSWSGSGGSLRCAAQLLKGPFLLLESDLLYEFAALRALLDDARENLLLAGRSALHDKVHVGCDTHGVLTFLDKNPACANAACGEMTGLCKVGEALRDALARWTSGNGAGWDYEQALVDLAPRHALQVVVRPDLLWCEIDDPLHYQQVRTEIWPIIKRRDHAQADS